MLRIYENRKKWISALCIIFFFCRISDILASEVEIPSINSPCYIVMDANNGEILFAKNEEKKVYPASITKLVTAMVVLDHSSIEANITITPEMLSHVPWDASCAGLRAGSTYTVYELLQMTLISSAADAAQALAEGCFESAELCIQKMNEKARELGLKETYFDNVIGLDIGNGYDKTYTTPREFAVLARCAMTYPLIRDMVGMSSYTIPAKEKNGTILRFNTNKLLTGYPHGSEYNITGLKTGTTNAAGKVLAASATDGEHEVLCLSFLNQTEYSRYQSVCQAFDYTFSQYNAGNLFLAKEEYSDWVIYDPADFMQIGWNFQDGMWYYKQKTGELIKNLWYQKGGYWYNFDETGAMRTGWYQDDADNWFYFLQNGSMQTGWLKQEEKNYYFDENGIMQTGWLQEESGERYYFDEDGIMQTGWLMDETGNWYYLSTDGIMQTGWLTYQENWYYLDSQGRMLSDIVLNGCIFDDTGRCLTKRKWLYFAR